MISVENYCKELGMEKDFTERTLEVCDYTDKILGEEIKDIFITNIVDKKDKQIFENMWLFSENYCSEAKNFLTENDIDIVQLQTVQYNEIMFKNYDLVDANYLSRLNIIGAFKNTLRFELKASGMNCDKLLYIFNKYLKPKI